jgi:hypothetical protein
MYVHTYIHTYFILECILKASKTYMKVFPYQKHFWYILSDVCYKWSHIYLRKNSQLFKYQWIVIYKQRIKLLTFGWYFQNFKVSLATSWLGHLCSHFKRPFSIFMKHFCVVMSIGGKNVHLNLTRRAERAGNTHAQKVFKMPTLWFIKQCI